MGREGATVGLQLSGQKLEVGPIARQSTRNCYISSIFLEMHAHPPGLFSRLREVLGFKILPRNLMPLLSVHYIPEEMGTQPLLRSDENAQGLTGSFQ